MKQPGRISVERKTYKKEPKHLKRDQYVYDAILSQEFKQDVWLESDRAFNKRVQEELLKLGT